MSKQTTDTIIIGAGGAGLAVAAYLSKAGHPYILLEQHDQVASSWRKHYDRLHLHTPKSASALPFLPFPESYPKYPSRDQLVTYLETYARTFNIQPVFNARVSAINRSDSHWEITTQHNKYACDHLVIATGSNRIPNRVNKPGLEHFPGTVIHSSAYRNGAAYRGKKVLVVGFGNSACEIAIDLYEFGARPTLSVRSPVNIIPRDIFGISALSLGAATNILPPRIADMINAPLIRLLIGSVKKLGLRKLPYGPKEQIIKYGRIPLLDIGTVALIRQGKIKVRDDIKIISGYNVMFEDGSEAYYDAIIMATGYHAGLEEIISISDQRLADLSRPMLKRKHLGEDNLYFCGYYISPGGMLNLAGDEAKIVSRQILMQDKTLSSNN